MGRMLTALLAVVVLLVAASASSAGVFRSRSKTVTVNRAARVQRVRVENIVVPVAQPVFVTPQYLFAPPSSFQSLRLSAGGCCHH